MTGPAGSKKQVWRWRRKWLLLYAFAPWLQAQSVQLTPFVAVNRAADIWHLTEAPNGQLAVTDYGASAVVFLSADGKTQDYQTGAFIQPAAIAFYNLDVGYSACNPAPLASRAFCLSGAASCPKGAEGVAPGNQNGFSYPRYVVGTSGGTTSSTFFVSNGGTGEIRLVDPVAGTQSTVAGGFTRSSGSNGPEQIVYDTAARTLYIADSGQNSVTAVDRASGIKTTLRTNLSGAFGLVRLANGDLLVSTRGDGKLVEITTQGNLVATYDTGLGPNVLRGLALTSTGNLYVVTDRNQIIYQVTLTSAAPPQVTTVNASSYRPTRVAPVSIAAAFVNGATTDTQQAQSLPWPVNLDGVTATVTDRNGTALAAQVYYVSPTLVDFAMPSSAAGGPGTITISGPAGSNLTGPLDIEAVAPGLFSQNGDGQGVPAGSVLRIRGDGSQSNEPVAQLDASTNRYVTLPIDLGPSTDTVFLILYGTGIRGRSSLGAVQVTIGGVAASVVFAGDQTVYPGLDQVNVQVPRAVAGSGETDLVLGVDGLTANALRINFK